MRPITYTVPVDHSAVLLADKFYDDIFGGYQYSFVEYMQIFKNYKFVIWINLHALANCL